MTRPCLHVASAALAATLLGAPAPADAAPPEDDAKASGKVQVQLGSEADAEAPKKYDPKELHKPWIKRFAPERNMAEIGIYGGLFFVSEKHDFYDPITAPQKPLWNLAADVGLRVAFFPIRWLGLEVEGNVIPTRARTLTDDFVLLYGFRAHPILQLPYYRITPFILAGGGMMGVNSSDFVVGKDVDPMAHYGGGLKVFLNRWLALRVEGRHLMGARAAEQNDITHHAEVLAGLSITIRPKPKLPPPPDPDRDKDGFLNEVDACPDTAGIAPDGCPPVDTDGDGFMDPDDKCVDEPGVAPDGCPIPDTDGDGFLDPDDKCPEEPETKNGFEDQDGCPDEIPEEIKEFTGVIEGIEFEFNKDEIRDVSRPTLDKAIEVLKEFTDLRLEISGHTDNIGTREANLDLSKRRAEAVRKYLVDGGVAGDRLTTRGAGPDEPIADNETKEGQAKNRRTEFKILVSPATGTEPAKAPAGEDAPASDPADKEPAKADDAAPPRP